MYDQGQEIAQGNKRMEDGWLVLKDGIWHHRCVVDEDLHGPFDSKIEAWDSMVSETKSGQCQYRKEVNEDKAVRSQCEDDHHSTDRPL